MSEYEELLDRFMKECLNINTERFNICTRLETLVKNLLSLLPCECLDSIDFLQQSRLLFIDNNLVNTQILIRQIERILSNATNNT